MPIVISRRDPCIFSRYYSIGLEFIYRPITTESFLRKPLFETSKEIHSHGLEVVTLRLALLYTNLLVPA